MSCVKPAELRRRLKKIKKPHFRKSGKKGKKYMVITPKGKLIHFGSSVAQHFKDSTGTGIWSKKDHGDPDRQRRYLARACGIKNGRGEQTWNDPESANYYSIHYLWSGK